MNKSEISSEEILEKIDIVSKRMKHAKEINDKIGYDIALKEYERLHKEYGHILYSNRKQTSVFYRRM